ncbi:methyl-accepting chemotaxis protein [Salinispirillum sp. LH 10-3-1]|uniref:Methyl-accepting chemotaxis protein n=1 Tax=Salinispirillum sp. LH 10-3-1 TaxID=2952525 RepID=A0AB38YFE5_9GAMM
MNMTVVRRTGLGFLLLLILMTVIAAAALRTQRATQDNVAEITTDVLPMLQSGYSLLISAQNINKAIAQHASEYDAEQLLAYESEFDREVSRYTDLRNRLRQQMTGQSHLLAQLTQADQSIQTLIERGREQLVTRQALLAAEQAYVAEVQGESSRWLPFPNEMRVVDRVMQILGEQTSTEASAIGADTQYVRDKIDLVRTEVTGSNTMTGVNELVELREFLQGEIQNTQIRIGRLETSNTVLFDRLGRFVTVLDRAVNAPEGTIALNIQRLSLQTQSTELLASIATDINTGVSALQGLTEQIASLSDALQRDLADRNQRANATIAGTYVVSLLLAILIVFSLIRSIRKPLQLIVSTLRNVSAGDLSHELTLSGRDEFAAIGDGINDLVRHLRDILQNMGATSTKVSAVTLRMTNTTRASQEKLRLQKEQTDLVAAAVTEMESATLEVAQSASGTLEEVQRVNHEAGNGQHNMEVSLRAIQALEQDLQSASRVIDQLNDDSENIGKILAVITGIAEQTNLLALNAAIEAARAGEQGRGFAVVADEVRELASKTQRSTEEIYQMIDALQSRSKEAVGLMLRTREQSQVVVDESEKTGASIQAILASLSRMSEMTTHISEAVNEQRTVASDVANNTVTIADMADQVVNNATQNASTFEELAILTQEQETLVQRFRF